MNWIQLNNIDQLKDIVQLSHTKPVLIFKHSTTCSISATSLSRFERQYDSSKAPNLQCYYLDLKAFRAVSNAVAEQLEVDHESPQVLLLANGQAVYNASHYDISFAEVVGAIA
jgi:bacillithiol system protein YtxJ